MKIFVLTSLFFLATCGASSATSTPAPTLEPETVQEEAVWEDLRIQKLMPGYMVFPAIEPFLPENFIALPHPDTKKWGGLFWGTRESLEDFFQKGENSPIAAPMLYVDLSPNVAQKQDGSFTGEDDLYKNVSRAGLAELKIDKLKWGEHPIINASFMKDGVRECAALIGLNYAGHVLRIRFFNASAQNTSSKDRLQIWTNFLTKSRPLEKPDFYKVHGQDLREGFTLVNVYGSVLKVSAEKRIKDGKIQIRIQPLDNTISCKCLSAEQKIMLDKWHFSEPIMKVRAEVQVSSTANVTSYQTIAVLLKEVAEFSQSSGAVNRSELNGISIVNFRAGSSKSKATGKNEKIATNTKVKSTTPSF